VPVPPVSVNPLSLAVVSSCSTIMTTLALSGCLGRLPSMMVRGMRLGSWVRRYSLATTIPLPPKRMFST